VRGTEWLTEDVCGDDVAPIGTRVTTVEGKVTVTDHETGATRTVKAGQSFMVKAP
jgi:hypothetical protein